MTRHIRDEAFAEAERYISEAARYKETTLSLDGLDLTSLPESLGQLARLEELDLSNNQLTTLNNNLSAANSQITDVDVAQESTNYAKYNILVQSGTAMLAQANQLPQSVLKLLS